MNNIRKQIEESIEVKRLILENPVLISGIEKAAVICCEALEKGNKILLAGNGGSAADAQHIAGELINRFGFERPGLAALSLSTDTSVITSISNDSGYDTIFARQVTALGRKGDVLVAISTSGNSANILQALAAATEKGMNTIGLTGKSGGKMHDKCSVILNMPSDSTPRIQESHIMTGHIICSIIENTLFGKK